MGGEARGAGRRRRGRGGLGCVVLSSDGMTDLRIEGVLGGV